METTALKIYFLINLVLVASYVFFRGGSGALRASDRLRTGQGLLLLAILISPWLTQLPRQMVPGFSLGMIRHEDRSAFSRARAEKTDRPKREVQASPLSAVETVSWTGLQPLLGKASLLLLFGFLLAVVRFASRWREVGQIVGASTLVHRIGRIHVAVSDEIVVPFSAFRISKSWVILSADLLSRPQDFRMALRHEIQHHRQRDTQWAVLIEALIALFYLNPMIYLWRKTLLELQEISCDAALVGHRQVASYEYGSCLIRVAEAALKTERLFAGTTSMALGLRNPNYLKSFLRRRIEMLPEHTMARPRRAKAIFLGTLLSVMTMAFAYGSQEIMRGNRQPNSGQVTVDPQIQEIALNAVKAAVKKHRADGGFAIVADPNTGRVLAVANVDQRANRSHAEYWSLAQRLRPASVVKAFVLATALEHKAAKVSDVCKSEAGGYHWDGHTYEDWKDFPDITLGEAVAQSSNICLIKTAQKLGSEALVSMYAHFGFGDLGSAEEFPQAIPGRVEPRPEGEDSLYLATLATGSALTTTPLEIVAAYGAIANGGNLLRPTSGDAGPQTIRRIMSEDTANQVKRVLGEVLTRGTATESQSKLYTFAGKTGSAQDPNVEPPVLGGVANVASFVGFAPLEKPRVVIYVGMIRPTEGDGRVHGSKQAAPVFREIAEKALQSMHVSPDKS